MKKVTLLAASVLAAAMMSPVANAYTPNAYFGGYFRSGVNHGNGGKMYKFNVSKVGRLGNEDDSYGEIFLGADVAQVDDTVWTVNTRLTAMSNNRNRDWQQTGGKNGEANEIALREFNLTAKGLLDWDKDAVVWAGKRFYKREDIHITDMYYYDISGYGAGLENLQVGPGKLDLAWVRQDDTDSYGITDKTYFVSLNKLDARYNFGLWDGASLQIGDTIYMTESQNGNLQKSRASNANRLGVELNIGHSMGWNKSVVDWFHGSNADGAHYGTGNWLDYSGNSNNANGFRFLNFGDTAFTDTFKVQHVLNVGYSSGYDKAKGTDNRENYSLVVRPFLQLTKMTRLIWEAGAYYDVEKKVDGTKNKEKGQKLTMAYALTPDASNVWSRPEIRFFVSYIHGTVKENGVSKTVNLTANEGKNVNHNIMFGVQAEAWW